VDAKGQRFKKQFGHDGVSNIVSKSSILIDDPRLASLAPPTPSRAFQRLQSSAEPLFQGFFFGSSTQEIPGVLPASSASRSNQKSLA
jgi:hypothetical protein